MKGVNLEHLQFLVSSVTDEVQRYLGRPLTEKEIALVFSISLKKLSEARPLKNDPEPMSLSEAQAYASLLEEFWKQTGMDPTDSETRKMIATARVMAGQGGEAQAQV